MSSDVKLEENGLTFNAGFNDEKLKVELSHERLQNFEGKVHLNDLEQVEASIKKNSLFSYEIEVKVRNLDTLKLDVEILPDQHDQLGKIELKEREVSQFNAQLTRSENNFTVKANQPLARWI